MTPIHGLALAVLWLTFPLLIWALYSLGEPQAVWAVHLVRDLIW